MNKKTINISDHLLAKFLDGKTDPLETEQVLSYLNESKENLEDFMNIRSAIQMDTESPIEIDLAECMDFVKHTVESSHSRKKTIQRRFYLITSFAAAAMVVGVISLLFFIESTKYNYLADNQKIDKNSTLIQQDSVSEQIFYIYKCNKELADNKHQDKNQPNITPEDIEEEMETQIYIRQHSTAYKTEGNLFEVTRPDKTPYLLLLKNLNKTFDFKWKTNAEKVEVILKDKAGNILLDKEILQDGLQLKYEEYYKHIEIHWELKATYQDATTEVKFGILQLMVE